MQTWFGSDDRGLGKRSVFLWGMEFHVGSQLKTFKHVPLVRNHKRKTTTSKSTGKIKRGLKSDSETSSTSGFDMCYEIC
jgi:hypothetical protein